jgi:hypothetical protein
LKAAEQYFADEHENEFEPHACKRGTNEPADEPYRGGDRTHESVPMQTDGGGIILVEPTELPNYPRDGESPEKFQNFG